MTNTESRSFNLPVDTVYGYCRYALTMLGYSIERENPVFNTLTGHDGGGLVGSPVSIEIKVDPAGQGKCVVSTKVYSPTLFGQPHPLYLGGQGRQQILAVRDGHHEARAGKIKMIPTLTFKFDCWGMKEITGRAVQVTSTVWQFDFDSWGTKRGTGTATKVNDDLWTIKFNSWGTKEGSGSIRRTSEYTWIFNFDSWGTKSLTGTATESAPVVFGSSTINPAWYVTFNSWGTKEGKGSIKQL